MLIVFVFRVVNCLVRLMHYYLINWLDMLDIGELTISSLYFVLAIWNFRASEWTYDNVISEAFKKNEIFGSAALNLQVAWWSLKNIRTVDVGGRGLWKNNDYFNP